MKAVKWGMAVAGGLLAGFAAQAAEIKVVTEYRYPTSYEVELLDANAGAGGAAGRSVAVGAVVTPTDFEMREVGVLFSVEAEVVDLARLGMSTAQLEDARRRGNTPLMMAAAAGDTAQVRRELIRGPFANVRNREGATALMGAATGGFLPAMAQLLRAGADPNIQSNSGATALQFAAGNGHTNAVALLLRAGARPDLADRRGVTPLLAATQAGYSDVAQQLLRAGARPLPDENERRAAVHRLLAQRRAAREAAASAYAGAPATASGGHP